METSDLLKDPMVSSSNGAHESINKEVKDNVSDLKEQIILPVKETSPIIIDKEFSPLPDRKELLSSSENISKDESSIHSSKESSPKPISKESSPQPLSKESSPLPIRKDSPEMFNKSFNQQSNGSSSPLLINTEEELLIPTKDKSPLITTTSGIDNFILTENLDTSLNTPLPCTTCDVEEAARITASSFESEETFPPPKTTLPKESQQQFEDPFGFNKPLPPEPIESTVDFLKSETNITADIDDIIISKKPLTPEIVATAAETIAADDDFMTDTYTPEIDDDKDDITTMKKTPSPTPPPIPKHQNLFEDLSTSANVERYEPTQTPEPDFTAFKPLSNLDDKFGEAVDVLSSSSSAKQAKPETVTTKTTSSIPIQQTSQVKSFAQSLPKKIAEVIGAKDIREKLDAWFNPARLHPQVESLIYWRDPKKSGVVFGITLITLLSLRYFSLISVVAYLCLYVLGGTITFRIYKNIMQAVQKTSDGHPFKDLLDIDLTIPEDKVAEVSQSVVHYLNTSLTVLRSLFLVEDLIDSIKFVVLLWVLTYVGACFNGLTLIILGVVLLFSLPKVYEKNQAQIDVYMKTAMDKLSIITNRMKAAVPEGKKDDKPKDQ